MDISINGQMLDAKAFGAKGDGQTDDTAALQCAIDAAAEVRARSSCRPAPMAVPTTGTDDDGQGGVSPAFGMVLRNLDSTVVVNNVMNCGYLRQAVVDLGGHGTNFRLEPLLGSQDPRGAAH